MFENLRAQARLVLIKVGYFQSQLLLALFYFSLFLPFALVLKVFADPLKLKLSKELKWRDRKPGDEISLEAARRQF